MAMRRAARYTLVAAATLVVVLLGLLLVVTRTGPGVERAGRFALDQVRGAIDGELAVGRITSDGLLTGATLHDVALTGPDGRPFVEADSARLGYRLRTILGGAIVFDRLVLHGPRVVIERLPGQDRWNYERIFSSDTTAPPDTTPGDLVLIRDVTIRDGTVTVRLPWEPDGPVTPDDTARLILEEVPGGLVRTVRFEAVDARVPRVVWDTPEDDAKLFEIEALSTRAFVWETPAEVRELEGVVTVRDSLVSFDAPRVRLPDSELGVAGQVILNDDENHYDIDVDGRDVSFADFQWLYPALPTDGGGTLQLRMQTQRPGSTLFLAREARLRTPGTAVAGSFGIVTGDTLYFTGVDLEASPLDLELLQRLVPSSLPLEGLLIGTVEVDGPVSALETRGDARLTALGASSRLRWSGTIGVRPPYALDGLDIEADSIDMERLAHFATGLRLQGSAAGQLRASGSIERGLGITGTVALDRDGQRSEVRGIGMFAVGGDRSAFDLRFDAQPVALELLSEQFPELGQVTGRAVGPVTVAGSLDDLLIEATLETPAGGVDLRGRFGLADGVSYRTEGTVTGFQLDRVAPGLPETVLTGRFDIEGEGVTLASARGRGVIDVLDARVAGVAVGRSIARGGVADGVIRLDSVVVTSEVGEARAVGSFGLMEGRGGELTFSARADQLSLLEPVVFPEVSAVVEEAPTARLGGEVTVGGVLVGSVDRWTARGQASARDLLYDVLQVGAATAEFDATADSVYVEAAVDSVRHQGRRLARADATVLWTPGGGRFAGSALGLGRQLLRVAGSFRPGADEATAIGLRELELTTRDGQWAAQGPVTARVGPGGVDVDSLVLRRTPDEATIRVAGSVPWRRPGDTGTRPADLTVELDRVRVGELLRVTQTDTTFDGVVTGRVRLAGTASSPVLDGRITARPFRYEGAVFDSAGGVLRYGDRQLRANVAGWRGGRPIVYGSGGVPVELALAPRDRRLLDRPLRVEFQADSLPAGLVSFLMPGFEEVDGLVDGQLALLGTGARPTLRGELRLREASGVFRPLNVRYRTMEGTARMDSGRVVRVEARLGTGEGTAHVSGTLDLERPGDPGFDLAVRADRLEATRRRDVAATVTGRARVGGRYTQPTVSGDLRIVEGEMNLDEIWRQYQIVPLDPSIFQVMDSAAVAYRPPAESPFLENLRVTATTIRADRGFWVRSRELNVEVSGELETEVDRQRGDFRITGTLEALAGDYALQLVEGVPARIFDIRSGTIEFVGTPGIDPNLEIEARYRVRRAQGDPLDVVASVSGTLQDPRVALTSDADFPLSESDLASYILFGRSGAELTQAQTDVVSRGLGLVRPVATGLLSSELQRALSGTGLPIDHVALTAPEYGLDQLGSYWQSQGLAGVFHNTQLEVGIDAGPNLSLVGSVRIPTDGTTAPEGTSPWRMFGARVEWRFRPSWTTEVYVEDRFARTPSFGLSEIDDRKVWGLSLFRDWGY